MKVHRYEIMRPAEIRWILSIDPGFRTSGFVSVDKDLTQIRGWGAPADKRGIQGVPFPDLIVRACERVDYYLEQLPVDGDPAEKEVVIEYTFLHRQFSTTLSVLLAAFVNTVLERKCVGTITLVQPRTSQWFLKLKSAKPSEIRSFVEQTFPREWSVKKRWNSHAADALLNMAFCHYNFFTDLGIELREPRIELITRSIYDGYSQEENSGQKDCG